MCLRSQWFNLFYVVNIFLYLTLMGSETKVIMSENMSWPNQPVNWPEDLLKLILEEAKLEKVNFVDLNQIIESSRHFENKVPFPIDSVRCEKLKRTVNATVLERNVNSVYPVLHERSLLLYAQFLRHKRKFGTELEKELYKNMTIEQLVDRLLKKRAVSFVGSSDYYKLINNQTGFGGWEKIGKAETPLLIENCISYEEIKLSALLSVSSYSYFINIGDRHNSGKFEANRDKVEEEGVIIGLIGPRFEKRKVMEFQDIVITKEQNVQGNGYGISSTLQGMFFNFYEEPSLTYEEQEPQFTDKIKFTNIRDDVYFNNVIYAKRLALSIDTLLIEANDRAKEKGTYAYVHVVGIGLGVWKIGNHQNKLFMDTFAKRIEFLGNKLINISDVTFSHINSFTSGKYKDEDIVPIQNHPLGGIKINIFNRDPHEKLQTFVEGKLLVVSYAWDGNALPGNEFWLGQLSASGDPAAAASSQISEIHNPHINPLVSGANLRVATLDGLVKFTDYQKLIKEKYKN